MQYSSLSFLALVSASAAWQVTIYNNVDGCEAKDDTAYRIIGAGQPYGESQCYTFDKPMPGTECAQYTNGGKDRPTSCTSDSLKPQSLYAKSGDDGGSCSFYSDENCKQDVVNVGDKCLDASFLPPKKIGSFKCRGKPVQDDCKVSFTRMSMQDGSSFLGSVSHDIYIQPLDKSDRPDVTLRTSCYNLIGYGKGCGWNKDETTQAEKNWAVKHEPYNAFADFSKDVTMFGNGCDNTVLKCKGSHSEVKVPDFTPGGKPKILHMSDTKCAPDGENVDFDKIEGDMVLAEWKARGYTTNFNGDMSTLDREPAGAAPGPYTCEKVKVSDTVCKEHWKCVDEPAKITAYFDASASFSATMSSNPEVSPISSPVCSNVSSKTSAPTLTATGSSTTTKATGANKRRDVTSSIFIA